MNKKLNVIGVAHSLGVRKSQGQNTDMKAVYPSNLELEQKIVHEVQILKSSIMNENFEKDI